MILTKMGKVGCYRKNRQRKTVNIVNGHDFDLLELYDVVGHVTAYPEYPAIK